MISKNLIYFPLACLILSMLVRYGYNSQKVTWHHFFIAPKTTQHKLLAPAKPFERTQEIHQKIEGKGYPQEQKPYLFFKAMAQSMKKQQKEEIPQKENHTMSTSSSIPPALFTPAQPQKSTKVTPPPQAEGIEKKATIDYFPVAFYRKKRKTGPSGHSDFILASIEGNQTVKHGRSIKIRSNKSFFHQGRTIPKGAIFYGMVAFGKERILVKLETATWADQAVPVEVVVYDLDYMNGLLVEDLLPFMESSQDRLLHQAISSSRNRWIQAISQTAIDAMQSMKKEPKVTLEHRRKVYLKPITKKT